MVIQHTIFCYNFSMRNLIEKRKPHNKDTFPSQHRSFFYTHLGYLLKYEVNKIVLLATWKLPAKYKERRNIDQTLFMVSKALHDLVSDTFLTSMHNIPLFSVISSHIGLLSILQSCSFCSPLIFYACSLCLKNYFLQSSHNIYNLSITITVQKSPLIESP